MIVDYLGTHQHLAIDLHCSADGDGAMCLRSGDLRFYEGPIRFRFPLLLAGEATVRETDNETTDHFEIDVAVVNKRFGRLFGYRGTFRAAQRPCTPDEVPVDVMPVREEQRE